MATTNLTNTVWYIPAGWTVSAGYGVFDMSGTLCVYGTNGFDKYNFDLLGFGNGVHFDDEGPSLTSRADSIVCAAGMGFNDIGLNPVYSFSLTITEDNSASSSELLAWLQANGTQITINDLTNTTWNIPAE